MFVPSLSWQHDAFHLQMAQTMPFFLAPQDCGGGELRRPESERYPTGDSVRRRGGVCKLGPYPGSRAKHEPFSRAVFICQARDNDQFTKTGSGQTQETVRNTRACMRFLTDAGRVREAGDSKTVFLRCHLLNKRTFYQDRLGTNPGNGAKHESMYAFSYRRWQSAGSG
jgi:hypothetical protein